MSTDEGARFPATSETAERTVVILARGLGTRMRRDDSESSLGDAERAAANAGLKGMIPIDRPFLDYVLTAIADAGYSRACLVIGPEHGVIRRYYEEEARPSRLSITFAIQQRALGTADAVLAAEPEVRSPALVVLNSDNYYPVEALRALRTARPPAIIGFARSVLIESGNVAAAGVGRFGALGIGADGCLLTITPRAGESAPGGNEVYASMNCWLFDRRIFDLCRRTTMSPRGELELPRAVQMGIDEGMKVRVFPCAKPVLDLSTRRDIASVRSKLAGAPVSY